MKRTVAILNLVLITFLFCGGAYVIHENLEPYFSFLDRSWKFLLDHYSNMYSIYALLLTILTYTIYDAFYDAIGTDTKKLAEQEKKLKEIDIKNNELIAINEKTTSEKNELESKYNELLEQQKNSIDIKKFNEASDKACKFENELNKELENVKSLKDDKKKLEAEIEAYKDNLAKLTNENKSLVGKLTKTEEINSQLNESEKNLKTELKNTKEELASANANLKGGKNAIPPAAYQILYMLQKEGRLLDMLNEDIGEYDDETLGGAFRKLHEDLRGILQERLIIEPVLNEDEGSTITLETIDPESIKISGKVPAKGPYTGELIHKGWRLKECKLPELVDGWKGDVIAPAEIEIE